MVHCHIMSCGDLSDSQLTLLVTIVMQPGSFAIGDGDSPRTALVDGDFDTDRRPLEAQASHTTTYASHGTDIHCSLLRQCTAHCYGVAAHCYGHVLLTLRACTIHCYGHALVKCIPRGREVVDIHLEASMKERSTGATSRPEDETSPCICQGKNGLPGAMPVDVSERGADCIASYGSEGPGVLSVLSILVCWVVAVTC